VVEFAARQQVVHGDFQQHYHVLAAVFFLLQKLRAGGIEHVYIDVRDRPERPALHQDGLLIKNFRRLQHMAVGRIHHRVGQPMLDEVEADGAIFDVQKVRPVELDHVHLDARDAEVVRQRDKEILDIEVLDERTINQVNADDAQGVLLRDGRLVPHAHVDDDVAGRGVGFELEAHAHPAVAFAGAFVVGGRDGVGVNEKRAAVAAGFIEPFGQQLVFVVEHLLQALARDIAAGLAVDVVAELHVVGRHALGDGARRPASLEKLPRHLLPRADFGKGAVNFGVEIDGQGFLAGVQFRRLVRVFVHGKRRRGEGQHTAIFWKIQHAVCLISLNRSAVGDSIVFFPTFG